MIGSQSFKLNPIYFKFLFPHPCPWPVELLTSIFISYPDTYYISSACFHVSSCPWIHVEDEEGQQRATMYTELSRVLENIIMFMTLR